MPDEALILLVEDEPHVRDLVVMQLGALGYAGPDIDIEMLVLARRLWQRLDIDNVELQINTIGSNEERRAFRGKLIEYFNQHLDVLDEDAKRRLHTNPLRILDSKNPAMQAVIEAAPKLMDHLGTDSRANFDAVLSGALCLCRRRFLRAN